MAVSTILQPPTSSGIASVLPKHLSATCPLDQILLNFICSRRALATKGLSVDAVVGPAQPCLQAVLNPIASYGIHATSRVLGEVLSTFSHVSLPEKLAFMFVMFRTMRVCIISATDFTFCLIGIVANIANRCKLRRNSALASSDCGPNYSTPCCMDR